MKLERRRNSLKGTAWGVIKTTSNIIGPFIIRTLIIYKLSAEYAGLNSLFTSILSILSLTELGFSQAIVYSMYKPIAEDNISQVCALLRLYRFVYKIIGSIILLAGILVAPFLKVIIKDDMPNDINLYILYFIFLFNTVISYFSFAYKTSILSAYQREDIVCRNYTLVNLILYIFQGIVISICSNYYYYVLLIPVSTIALNIINAYAVDKYYPELICQGNIGQDTIFELKKQVCGLMIWKIGSATRNTLDNIIISIYFGLTSVTIYNNYYIIMSGVIGMLGVVTSSIRAGIGNKIAISSVEENYCDFNKFQFMYCWIAGMCTICLACLYQPFMSIWMGRKLMLDNGTMFLICLYFFILKIGDINSTYYQAAGLWWHGRYRSIVESLLNIILNLTLGYYFGVTGIVAATIISIVLVWFYGSGIIFWNYFTKHSVKEYYLQCGLYLTVTFTSCCIIYMVCECLINDLYFKKWEVFLIRLFVCLMLSNLFFWIVYHKTDNYKKARNFARATVKIFGGKI